MRSSLKATIVVAVILALIVGLLNYFVVQTVDIGHDGMAPTMLAGDKVLMWRNIGETQMGDVLLCPSQAQPGAFVLGRVVAKPGMKLEVDDGVLIVAGTRTDKNTITKLQFLDQFSVANNVKVSFEQLGNSQYTVMDRDRSALQVREKEIKDGVFLLGDNRFFSNTDSRTHGPVDPATCLGKVFMRLKAAEGRDFPDHEELKRGKLDLIP